MNYNKRIGYIIKLIRLFSGMKQKDLARELNIAPSLLSQYEQGKREPTLRFIVSLCNYVDIEVSHFFHLSEQSDELFDDNPQSAITSINNTLGRLKELRNQKKAESRHYV